MVEYRAAGQAQPTQAGCELHTAAVTGSDPILEAPLIFCSGFIDKIGCECIMYCMS